VAGGRRATSTAAIIGRVIEIGRRRTRGGAWNEQGRLARTAAFLRGHEGLVPRGVYRFSSFEEADAWMTRTMAETHERLSRKTSSASAGR
jgi:hypothetical protein